MYELYSEPSCQICEQIGLGQNFLISVSQNVLKLILLCSKFVAFLNLTQIAVYSEPLVKNDRSIIFICREFNPNIPLGQGKKPKSSKIV